MSVIEWDITPIDVIELDSPRFNGVAAVEFDIAHERSHEQLVSLSWSRPVRDRALCGCPRAGECFFQRDIYLQTSPRSADQGGRVSACWSGIPSGHHVDSRWRAYLWQPHNATRR